MNFKRFYQFAFLLITTPFLCSEVKGAAASASSILIDPLEPYLKAGIKPTTVRFSLQDASVTGAASADGFYEIPQRVLAGPSDKEFQVQGLGLAPDASGNFVGTYTPAQQRGLELYALSRMGANIHYDNWLYLKELNPSSSIIRNVVTTYKVGYTPVLLYDARSTDAEEANAFYTRYTNPTTGRMVREGRFMHYTSDVDSKVRYASASSDVVWHEVMGHGYLDEQAPALLDTQTLDAAGFHEGFADAEAMLLTLRFKSQRKALITATEGKDIVKDNFVSNVGEEFGIGLGMPAIRDDNITEAISRSSVPQECHEYGRVYWASAIWEILKGAYNGLLTPRGIPITDIDRSTFLKDCAQYLQMSMSLALRSTGKEIPGIQDFASQMYRFASDPSKKVKLYGASSTAKDVNWEAIIKSAFTRRGISVQGGSGRSAVGLLSTRLDNQVSICGTLHKHLDTRYGKGAAGEAEIKAKGAAK